MPATKHIRQQIREKVQTTLTGLTTTGANVFMTRNNPLSEDEGELPGLLIGSDPQTPTIDRVVQRSQGCAAAGIRRANQRTMRLPVRGYHKVVASLENVLDTVAKEVEVAMFADPLLGGVAFELRLMDTTITTDGSGDKPVGMVEMNFEVDYWCVEGAPDVVTN